MKDHTADRNLPNNRRRRPVISLRPEPDVFNYIKDLEKTEFINRACRLLIRVINSPESLLKELKMRNPELYKYVGRKKYD